MWSASYGSPSVIGCVDFACPERKLAIELDGGQHAFREEADERRGMELARRGYRVIRFWNNEVFENIEGVLEAIRQCLERRETPSPPNPPLEGEGFKA